MLSRWSRVLGLLFCLCLCLQLCGGQSTGLVRRQEGGTSEAPDPTGTGEVEAKTTDRTDDYEPTSTTVPQSGDAGNTTASGSDAPSSTGTEDLDDNVLEETVPEGQLPLPPRLTPAYGVAGVLLIIAGAVYLTIGIKNPWLHIFLSVTLLGNLATTVLILYVMTVPVSDGIQGAYLVAVTITGLALGAGSTIFKEVTEGLGCILGGFSLAMWILTLVPGGLIEQTAGKSIFIAGMSLAAFGLFFSHYTRDYAVIGLIAFGGATAMVIGIDCYTRAGLKEFWAYIWDLNENLFPDGAHSYPITKGMRVESAVIVLLFLVGIISQMKLWRVIQERRAKRAAEKAEDQRNLQAEEEAVGRDVEERTARERRVWERAYGDRDSGADVDERDSEFGVLSEKRMRVVSGSTVLGSLEDKGMMEGEKPLSDAAPNEPPQSPASLAGIMASGGADGAKIMVRVVPDELPRAPDRGSVLDPEEEQAQCQDASQNAQEAVDRQDEGVSRVAAASPPPDVVPLPFQVQPEDDEDRKTERSSIAGTYAGDDERPQSRRSIARRLSQGSTNILRSLSQRTDRNRAPGGGESREMLVRRSVARSDDGSLVATVDGESLSDERSTVGEDRSIEITADLAREGEAASEEVEVKEESAQPVEVKDESDRSTQPSERQETAPDAAESVAPSRSPNKQKTPGEPANATDAPAGSTSSKQKSSSEASIPLQLTRDTLPEPLSRTALKYRTNEWVKHSTTADAPEPEEIYIDDVPEPDEPVGENPAPLDVNSLQQTATTGTPAPAPPRSSSAMSNYQTPTHPASRDESRLSTSGRTESARPVRRQTSGMPLVDPIPEEPRAAPEDDRSSSRASASPSPFRRAASASPGVVQYSDPQTLIGKRETYIRNKPMLMHAPLNGAVGGGGSREYLPLHYAPSEYAGYAPRSRSRSPDEDDMPLSQRRALIRQSSAFTLQRPPSTVPQTETFNSHQPQRVSAVPPPLVREAQLANFRQSVAAGLRAGTPTPAARGGLEALMREREMEAMAREAQRWEAERREGAFVEAMRSGELAEAHREALRRMQGRARES